MALDMDKLKEVWIALLIGQLAVKHAPSLAVQAAPALPLRRRQQQLSSAILQVRDYFLAVLPMMRACKLGGAYVDLQRRF